MPKVKIENSVGLDGVNDENDVQIVQERFVQLGFDWLGVDGKAGPQTTSVIRLFQAIKNGLSDVDSSKNDGLIEVGKATHLWLEAANAPHWQLMPGGSKEEGFINDEVLSQTSDNHDFGTDWLADTLSDTGAEYLESYVADNPDAAVVTINDTSVPRGGDTPHHAGHESGIDCDIRLPRKDGGAGGVTVSSSNYDRNAMRAMLQAFKDQKLFDLVYLNDTTLQNEGLCRHASGHDNHAHFSIKPPVREMDED